MSGAEHLCDGKSSSCLEDAFLLRKVFVLTCLAVRQHDPRIKIFFAELKIF